MNYEKLFKYMSDEHGITLLESEMQEICKIVNEIQGDESQQKDVSDSICKCPICLEEMKGIQLIHYKCKKCNEYFTN